MHPRLPTRQLIRPEVHAARSVVEDLVKIIQQLPASASAVEAIAAGLGYLDSRAAAALLKGLAKAGVGHRSVEIFDYLRDLPDDHDLRT
eukprot:gene7912-8108_t